MAVERKKIDIKRLIRLVTQEIDRVGEAIDKVGEAKERIWRLT